MEYNPTMNLISPSGYAMPFELPETCPLEITMGYGQQTTHRAARTSSITVSISRWHRIPG